MFRFHDWADKILKTKNKIISKLIFCRKSYCLYALKGTRDYSDLTIDCVSFQRYLFGAIFGRDDCYKSIMSHGRQTNLSWAEQDPNTTSVSAWSSRTQRHKASESPSVRSSSVSSYRLSELQGDEQKDDDDDDSQLYIGNVL